MNNISYHGSHNGGLVVEKDGQILCVLEFERFLNYKNVGTCQYKTPRYIMICLDECLKWIEREYGISDYENCYFSNVDFIGEDFFGKQAVYHTYKIIKAKNYIHGTHHESHAYGCFYQSPFDEALIFSFDGGGDDGKFNIYLGKKDEPIKLLETVLNPIHNHPHIYYNLGFSYMVFGNYFKDLGKDCLADGNLVWPGKIMGLVSYGKPREEWLSHFIEFYKSDPDGRDSDFQSKIKILGEKINVIFDTENQLEGQIEYDVAATSQKAFEECFLEVATKYFSQYPNLPVCIAGGCALNILLNTRIKDEFNKKVFVGPNPSDCGIAVGHMLKYLKPKEPIDLTYSGVPILDKNTLSEKLLELQYVRKLMPKNEIFHAYEQWDPSILVEDLISGKIIGIVKGNSEHGPRALGNRSIICNPSFPEMKNILNAKVKNREWYRPFAPVVRLEDVSKYFEFNEESRWMNFCPKVKEEWREKLSSITHVDNTARVQTVTKKQNEFLYNLLTEFEKETGFGVLLNTSFNVNGKPILSTYKDAIYIFNNTKLDCLLLEDNYIRKEEFVSNKKEPEEKIIEIDGVKYRLVKIE